jgi:hypothetical protein
MAPHDAPLGAGEDDLRQTVHEDLRESVVELYESDDPPGVVAQRVWRRCERVRHLLHLAGHQDERVQRAAELLAPVCRAHLAVDALDQLGAVVDDEVRDAAVERAATLDGVVAPGCATPEVAASLLADADGDVDRWPLRWTDPGGAAAALEVHGPDADVVAWHDQATELADQLAFAASVPGPLAHLCDVLEQARSLDTLESELGPDLPAKVRDAARARRAALVSEASAARDLRWEPSRPATPRAPARPAPAR